MPYVFPLFGGHKIDQLRSNIDALRFALTEAHVKEIESVASFDPVYPHKYIVRHADSLPDKNVVLNTNFNRVTGL